ncbi:RHS domain-containing protein [Proteus vulgaris]|uniref:RHS domain-containing protein n=1 Tax=Proteus vulgaris TaxID=585 RepID=UPI001FF6FD2A|nr:RHS domain-containing protein [Proteus vulgaris]
MSTTYHPSMGRLAIIKHGIDMLYIYEDVGSYSPLARVDTLKNKQTVFYFHCQPNGLPDALVDGNGDIQWQARFTSWDKTEIELGEFHYYPQNRDQNLRFQGQYLDRDKFVGNKFEQHLRWPVGRVSG